jgi:hypothetical protein
MMSGLAARPCARHFDERLASRSPGNSAAREEKSLRPCAMKAFGRHFAAPALPLPVTLFSSAGA